MSHAVLPVRQEALLRVLGDLRVVLSLGTAHLPAELDRRVLEVGCEGLAQHIHLQRDPSGDVVAYPSPELVALARDLKHHALQGVPR